MYSGVGSASCQVSRNACLSQCGQLHKDSAYAHCICSGRAAVFAGAGLLVTVPWASPSKHMWPGWCDAVTVVLTIDSIQSNEPRRLHEARLQSDNSCGDLLSITRTLIMIRFQLNRAAVRAITS
jgi:hypothetical protein